MQHVYTFDSLGEFIAAADVPRPVNPASDTAWNVYHDDWAGGSREGAFDKARHGWPEGRAKMVDAMAKARPSVSLPPAFTMDVAGAYPDPAAAAAGAPDCMVSFDPVEVRHKPIVRIAVNVWASGAYEPNEFTNYGAAVLSYIDAIESSGFRVELTMLCHCKMSRTKDTYSGRVMIKRAEEPLDIDRVAFCLTHPSMLRRLWFGHMQVAPGAAGNMPCCGYPENPSPRDMEQGVLVVPGINTIKPGHVSLRSPQAAAVCISDMMGQVLSEAGVELPGLAFGAEGVK